MVGKYPRTPVLPWSGSKPQDDRKVQDLNVLQGKTFVYTEKLDGKNTKLSRHVIHARSVDGYKYPWQTWMKRVRGEIRHLIPEGIEIYGENLYAIHSIEYERLPSYFFVFNVAQNGMFLPWTDVKAWAKRLNLPLVPVLKIGLLERLSIPSKSYFGGPCEGYVIRNVDGFRATEFEQNVAKCVRKNHVQTDEHWRYTWRKAKSRPGQ